jgi:hypothetical protein
MHQQAVAPLPGQAEAAFLLGDRAFTSKKSA